jgi:septum formation protein
MREIILASASAGRKEVMDRSGIPYRIEPSDYHEDFSVSEDPEVLVKTFSLGKAWDVAEKNPEAIVIGADSVVVFEGEILGKPGNAKRAKEILEKLSGNASDVVTGLALVNVEGKHEEHAITRSTIFMKVISASDMRAYSQTKESQTGAGAYKIQGEGGKFVERIEGDKDGIIGLPLVELKKLLEKFGVVT